MNRALVVGAVLCAALVSGGMLIQGGSPEVAEATPVAPASPRLFEQVMERLRYAYIDTLTTDQMLRLAATGVVEEVDERYSELLTPERLSRIRAKRGDRAAGVGLVIDIRDGFVTVIAPIEGTPADSAGIAPGNRILSIDGKSTYRLTLEEIELALEGSAGSQVRLAVDMDDATRTFTLSRRMIAFHPVRRSQMFPGNVGYVKVATINQDAEKEIRRAVDSLRAASLVLDLRANPGGELEHGVAVASLFLDPAQTIAQTRGRAATETRKLTDSTKQAWPALPVVVLVDSGTASAAEIVAGALQDNGRAVVVGSSTYGKGSAQTLLPLPNGYALKLTTSRWLTPKGRVIERDTADGGIEPDVEVTRPEGANEVRRAPSSVVLPSQDPALQRALELLRGVRTPAELRSRVPAKPPKKD